MICEHDDCFTCPYPDCVAKYTSEVHRQKKKRGRKPIDPEEKRQNRRAYSKEYYWKTKNISMSSKEHITVNILRNTRREQRSVRSRVQYEISG